MIPVWWRELDHCVSWRWSMDTRMHMRDVPKLPLHHPYTMQDESSTRSWKMNAGKVNIRDDFHRFQGTLRLMAQITTSRWVTLSTAKTLPCLMSHVVVVVIDSVTFLEEKDAVGFAFEPWMKDSPCEQWYCIGYIESSRPHHLTDRRGSLVIVASSQREKRPAFFTRRQASHWMVSS